MPWSFNIPTTLILPMQYLVLVYYVLIARHGDDLSSEKGLLVTAAFVTNAKREVWGEVKQGFASTSPVSRQIIQI